MPMLAATTLAALLVASPGMSLGVSPGVSGAASDASRVAVHGGFLLGHAQRCGIADERIVQAGKVIRRLIAAAAEDAHEQEEASARFASLFIVSAAVDPATGDTKGIAAPPSCQKVTREFDRLEKHVASLGTDKATGGGKGGHFRTGDGE